MSSDQMEASLCYAADKALYPQAPWIRVAAHCCSIAFSEALHLLMILPSALRCSSRSAMPEPSCLQCRTE